MKPVSEMAFPAVFPSLIVGMIAFAATYLLTSPMVLTPMYEAETIIYVPLFVPARQMEQQGIGFASDKEIDGHIQILISGKMKDTLTGIFNLYEEFGIDKNAPGAKSSLYKVIDDHVSIQKTRYSSVSVTVENKDPQKAADMANTLVKVGDIIKENLLALNRRDAVRYAKKLLKTQKVTIGELEMTRDSVIAALPEGRDSTDKLRGYQQILKQEYKDLMQKRENYKTERENMDTPLPSSYVLTYAVPSEYPVWPPRIMLSVAALLLSGGLLWIIQLFLRSAKTAD